MRVSLVLHLVITPRSSR